MGFHLTQISQAWRIDFGLDSRWACRRASLPHADFSDRFFPQQLKDLGSAQIGSGVVRGGPEVRFHEASTRVPPGFEGSTRVPRGSARAAGWCMLLGISPELIFLGECVRRQLQLNLCCFLLLFDPLPNKKTKAWFPVIVKGF